MATVTVKRPRQDILKQIIQKYPDRKPAVFILGCKGGCAEAYKTGGRKQVSQLARYLKQYIGVTGTACVEWLCQIERTKAILRRHRKKILESDAVIVLSCGGGIITICGLVNNIDVIPGLMTIGSGPEPGDSAIEIKGAGDWGHPICRSCGKHCVADDLFGLCPEDLCPLHRRDSPCSENSDLHSEKCVVKNNRDNKCFWWEINRLRKQISLVKGEKRIVSALLENHL